MVAWGSSSTSPASTRRLIRGLFFQRDYKTEQNHQRKPKCNQEPQQRRGRQVRFADIAEDEDGPWWGSLLNRVHTYAGPSAAEKELVYLSSKELAEIESNCQALIKKHKRNANYGSFLKAIMIGDIVPGLASLDDECGSSSCTSLECSCSSQSSFVTAAAAAFEEARVVEEMRGLEHRFSSTFQKHRRSRVQSVLDLQAELKDSNKDADQVSQMLRKRSVKYSAKFSSFARSLAEWDAIEAMKERSDSAPK